METKANYLMVGVFVVVLFVGLIGFVLWLGKFQTASRFDTYDIYFEGSVAGLSEGSSVTYRGVTVGQVEEIRIAPEDLERIRVTIRVAETTPVRTDTRASLELQGITGGSVVMLSGGSTAAPPLEPTRDQERAVIESQSSRLERVLEGAPALVESVQLMIHQASDLLNVENREAFADTLRNVRDISAALADQAPQIRQIVTGAAETIDNLNTASRAVSEVSEDLSKNLVGALRSVEGAIKNLESAGLQTAEDVNALVWELQTTARTATSVAREIEAMVKENRQPIRDFASTGLYELSTFLSELRLLVAGLNRVTTEVGRDPARFLFGRQQDGYEAR